MFLVQAGAVRSLLDVVSVQLLMSIVTLFLQLQSPGEGAELDAVIIALLGFASLPQGRAVSSFDPVFDFASVGSPQFSGSTNFI